MFNIFPLKFLIKFLDNIFIKPAKQIKSILFFFNSKSILFSAIFFFLIFFFFLILKKFPKFKPFAFWLF